MACPDLAQETLYFDALERMSLVEVQGDTLILSNDTGEQMVFRAE
ncbi:MAG: META domain-containing protein [Pseudomonadota bacterium]